MQVTRTIQIEVPSIVGAALTDLSRRVGVPADELLAEAVRTFPPLRDELERAFGPLSEITREATR